MQREADVAEAFSPAVPPTKEQRKPVTAANKRLARNTLFLYGRKILTLLIALYSSRVLLKYLGVDDFGLYGLVGSVVVIFNSLRSLFASSVQRFLNVQNEQDAKVQNQVFCVGMSVHVILALAFILLVEIGGLLILPTLNIAPEKLSVAQWVLQFSILAAAVSILTTPYDAVLMARERFDAYALFSILDSLLRLGVIFLLVISPMSRVVFYSILIFGVSLLVRGVNALYCRINFPDLVRFRIVKKSPLYKEMTRFAGWNFFGNLGYSLTNEGVNLILNLFGGIVANAARTIAAQINSGLGSFTRDLNVTFVPQSMKAFANGEKSRFYSLQFFCAKAAFTILFILGVPLVALAPQILSLWLVNVPEHAVNFVRAILFYMAVRSLHGPIDIAFKSANRLKRYQICEISIMIMNLPVSWILLRLGAPLWIPFLVMGVIEVINLVVISIVAHREIDFEADGFFARVLMPSMLLAAAGTAAALCIPFSAEGLIPTLAWFALIALIAATVAIFSIFTAKEREKLLALVHVKK